MSFLHSSTHETPTGLRRGIVLTLAVLLAFPPSLFADAPAKSAPPAAGAEQPKSPPDKLDSAKSLDAMKPETDKPSPPKETLVKRRKPQDPAAGKSVPEKTPSTSGDAKPETKQSEMKKPQETPKADKPAPSETPLRGESTKPASPPAPSGKKPAPEDESLLRSLDPTQDKSDGDDVERLERAIAGMREAQQRVEGKDAGKGTQEIQARVVKDLEVLLDALQKPQSPPPDQNQDPQQQYQQKQKQKPKQQAGKRKRTLSLQRRRELVQRQMQKQPGKGNEKQQTNQRDREKSPETSENQRMKKTEKTEQDRQQELVKDVWGHLPPNVRAELLNVFSEKYLPKYEDLVRRYYEALAEKNRTRNPGR